MLLGLGVANDFAKIAKLIKYPGLERFRDLFLANASILDIHEVGLKVKFVLAACSGRQNWKDVF